MKKILHSYKKRQTKTYKDRSLWTSKLKNEVVCPSVSHLETGICAHFPLQSGSSSARLDARCLWRQSSDLATGSGLDRDPGFGFMFRVIVLLEGEPLPQSSLLQTPVPPSSLSLLREAPQSSVLPPPLMWHLLQHVRFPHMTPGKLQIEVLMVLLYRFLSSSRSSVTARFVVMWGFIRMQNDVFRPSDCFRCRKCFPTVSTFEIALLFPGKL